jgi:hypothetical protein
MPRLIEERIATPITQVRTDQTAHVPQTVVAGVPSMITGGQNETVNWSIPLNLPRVGAPANVGVKLKSFDIDYKVLTGALTSFTVALYRYDKKADGVNNAAVAINLTATKAMDAAVDTLDQKARYTVTVPDNDSVAANNAAASAVAATSDAEYWVNIEQVTGGNSGTCTLYGVTAVYERAV